MVKFFQVFGIKNWKENNALGVQINHLRNKNLQVDIISYDPKSYCNILLCKGVDYDY